MRIKSLGLWSALLISSFALVAAGCGGDEESAGSTTAEGGAEAAEQVFTVNWGSEPPSLDPGLASDTTSANILLNIMDPLVELDELKVYFPIKSGLFLDRHVGDIRAVDGVSLEIRRGETLGPSAWDGYAAAAVCAAGVAALRERRRVPVELAERPALYGGAPASFAVAQPPT